MTVRWPMACFLALGLFWGAWAALIPDLKLQVGASDAELGLALLFAGVGAIPAMLATGRLWRRTGWRLLPLAGVLFALSMLLPIFATTPLTLGIATFMVGAASGVLDVSMNAAVSDVEASRGKRLMFGAHALFSLGVLISAIATGFARQFGAEPVHVLGTASLVTTLIAVGSIRSSLAAHVARVDEPPGPGSAGSGLVSGIALLAGLCALAFLVEDGVQNWSALHLERDLGAAPALGGAAPGVFAGAMFFGRAMGQRLGARFSDRALLSGGAFVAALGTALVAVATTPFMALAGLGVAGAGISTVAPALFARAGRMTDPRNRAAAIARVTSLGYSGFITGPGLVGVVAQLTNLRTAILVLALLALAVALGGYVLLRGPDRTANPIIEGEELLKTGRA